MKTIKKTYDQLVGDIDKLRVQLEEANETIEAIRSGQVDAFIFKNINGHELYTLKTADQTYRIFIEKMFQGAVTLNTKGIVVFSNSQFAKMVGLPLSQVTGKAFNTFVKMQDVSVFEALVRSGWEKDITGELSIINADRFVPVQLSLITLELDEGFALSIILTDLTTQRENQLLLKVNNEKLSQLNHALEQSNHDLLQFASVASHDLQEPLRKIQIFSQLIKEEYTGKLSDEADLYLDKIKSACKRMKNLIIDILNYSRLSKADTLFEMTDLNLLMRELLEDFELVIKEKGAQIMLDDLPLIEVNRGQIRQLFQNIISNALKFTRKEVVATLQISSKLIADASFDSSEKIDGSFCRISFKDNGIGFDEKYATEIFTLFSRLHTKDKFEGTGIGLSVSKKIVEKHSGLIMANSKKGEGAEIIIILPVLQRK